MLRVVALALILTSPTMARDYPLAPQFDQGDEHHYLQAPQGAAAVSLTCRPVGRLVVAFPSGNSGVGLWLDRAMPAGAWRLEAAPQLEPAGAGVARQAVRGTIVFSKPGTLGLRAPLGGSLRFLRTWDRQEALDPREAVLDVVERLGAAKPAPRAAAARAGLKMDALATWIAPKIDASRRRLAFTWGTLAGAPGHLLELTVDEGGTLTRRDDGRLVVETGPAARLRFRATCAFAPLTPWGEDEVFAPEVRAKIAKIAAVDAKRATALREGLGRLRFLVYREKLLAGSWRYLTYFGRDTLLTLRMLREVFTPAVAEAALASVIERLSPVGQVAHEEDLGDQATLDRAREVLDGRPLPGPIDGPVYDYKMVDSDFLLPIALAEYAQDPRVGAARAKAFLAAGDRAAGVVRNARRVVEQAVTYAATRKPTALVALIEGSEVGDWRDSYDGLARGRYAYSLNAVLIPQALDALEKLVVSGVIPAGGDLRAPRLGALKAAWAGAHAHFRVTRSAAEVREMVGQYLSLGPLEPGEQRLFASWAASEPPGEMAFPAVSLDAAGKPIPVMCSDGALALFGPPLPAGELPGLVRPLVARFPVGLLTPAGLLVASPSLSGSIDLWARFARRHYHGTVVWAWPMAMAEMGLVRQLTSLDASSPARGVLERARQELRSWRWKLAERGLGELWAFRADASELVPTGFGASAKDMTEANALQLWSAAWLALALND